MGLNDGGEHNGEASGLKLAIDADMVAAESTGTADREAKWGVGGQSGS